MSRPRFSRRPGPVCAVWVAAALVLPGGTASATAPLSACAIDGDRVLVTLEAPPPEIVDTADGQRLSIDGFDALAVPGRPRLPVRQVLVALPPGLLATSVELLEARTVTLPGTFDITPAPPIAILPGIPDHDDAMQRLAREWQAEHDAAYGSDRAFPESPVWLAGRGMLHRISYASIAFCPVTYHPRSGRLEHHAAVRVAIRCEPIATSGREAQRLDRLLADPTGDSRAARLFANHATVAPLYAALDAPDTALDERFDYVIITTTDLRGALSVSGFEAWKASCGYSVRTVLTTDPEIADQPRPQLAQRIREFLRAYQASWGIRYVLMVGDYATVPMRICFPDPEIHVYNPGNPGLVAPGTPTDAYYADLSLPDELSWDSDGDGYPGEYGEDQPDFLAEVAVGRIPVNETTRIIHTLQKLIAFEQDTGVWKHHVLHAGSILFFANQNHSGYPFVDGSTLLDSLETGLMAGRTITHLTEREGLVTSPFDWPPISESSFTTAWGDGAHAIVNWSGHGWPDGAYRTLWVWDDGDGVPESSMGELESRRFIGPGAAHLDEDHPSIVFAISCNVGYPEPNPYGNLGIDLLTLPGWGTSAGIVSASRPAAVSGDWKHDGGGTEQICYDFNRHLVVEEARVGDALYRGKFDAHTAYGWDRVYEYMNLYNFNLYGDPALDLDGGGTVGLAEGPDGGRRGVVGTRLARLDAAPNPFAAGTLLRWVMPAAGRVRITVHDANGRWVATLADGRHAAGPVTLGWDGHDDAGAPLGSGIYFVRIEAAGQSRSGKLVRVR